jgi:phytoene dehydrogenase-like protein
VTVSRRELLRGLAGVPLLGCRSKPRPKIAGAIVGGAHQRGHRLREGGEPKPTRTEETGVAILGGGIAGLSAAWRFERAGLGDLVVLELEDAPGGTARSGRSPVTPYPWGAHYVPVPSPANRPLIQLLEEVGAVEGRDAQGRPVYAEQVLCRDPQERIFFKGEWHEGLYPRLAASRDDLGQLERFEAEMRELADRRDRHGRRAFGIPRAESSDEKGMQALDRQSMADWLKDGGFSSPRLRWFVEYGCRDDFGATLEQTSAWAGIHYFAARLEPGGKEPAEFLTWPEGNGRLVSHLAKTAGNRIRLGALVAGVSPGRDAVDVVYVDDTSHEAVRLRARHVVFALPRFLARRLIAPWRARPPAWLDATEYGSWMVANLTLRDRPRSRGFQIAWDNVLYESDSLGYVVATHQSGVDQGPTVWTYYLPILDDDVKAGRARLLETSWDAWRDRILADLGRAHPGLEELVERIDVYLWGHAMVRPKPGYLWSEALRQSARPLGRIHFAHTDLSGMALFEEAQYWGIKAAEAILKEQRHAFTSWLA